MFQEIGDVAAATYPIIANLAPGQILGFLTQKKAVADVTIEKAKQDLHKAANTVQKNKGRSVYKTVLAGIDTALIFGEDAVWIPAVTTALNTQESTVSKTTTLGAIAAGVAAVNTVVTLANIKDLSADFTKRDEKRGFVGKVKRGLAKFATSMAIGPPINATTTHFTNKEAVGHSLAFGVVGTALTAGIIEGIGEIPGFEQLTKPSSIAVIAGGVLAARYTRNACALEVQAPETLSSQA